MAVGGHAASRSKRFGITWGWGWIRDLEEQDTPDSLVSRRRDLDLSRSAGVLLWRSLPFGSASDRLSLCCLVGRRAYRVDTSKMAAWRLFKPFMKTMDRRQLHHHRAIVRMTPKCVVEELYILDVTVLLPRSAHGVATAPHPTHQIVGRGSLGSTFCDSLPVNRWRRLSRRFRVREGNGPFSLERDKVSLLGLL